MNRMALPGRARSLALFALTALAVCLAMTAPAPASGRASALCFEGTAGVSLLPADLVLPATDRGRIVRAVAADIDADGDLDVVSNDASLALTVWVNDGTGHLTRRAPGHSASLWPMPPAPSFESGLDASEPSDQFDPPTAGASTVAVQPWLARASLVSRVPRITPASPDASLSSPRAPPRSARA